MGNGSEPSHAGDGICSDATGDGSCSIPGAVGDGICTDAMGDGSRGRSSAGRPVLPHRSPCDCEGRLKPSNAGDGSCSDVAGYELPIRLQCRRRRLLFGPRGSGRRHDDICSDATGDGSCSVSDAADNGICADATG